MTGALLGLVLLSTVGPARAGAPPAEETSSPVAAAAPDGAQLFAQYGHRPAKALRMLSKPEFRALAEYATEHAPRFLLRAAQVVARDRSERWKTRLDYNTPAVLAALGRSRHPRATPALLAIESHLRVSFFDMNVARALVASGARTEGVQRALAVLRPERGYDLPYADPGAIDALAIVRAHGTAEEKAQVTPLVLGAVFHQALGSQKGLRSMARDGMLPRGTPADQHTPGAMSLVGFSALPDEYMAELKLWNTPERQQAVPEASRWRDAWFAPGQVWRKAHWATRAKTGTRYFVLGHLVGPRKAK